jgi:hypothetical protein
VLGQMVGNVDDLMYVVLSRAKNTWLQGISWYHRMYLLMWTGTYTVLIRLKNEYHPDCYTYMWVKKQSCYRPGVAQSVPGS